MQSLKQALTDAGIEIYGETDADLRIAERHRYHLMDSGVVARMDSTDVVVSFAIRAQRSDFQHVDVPKIFDRIRDVVGQVVVDRGYSDGIERVVDMNDPVDASKVLDTWYELEFTKRTDGAAAAIDEIRWALTVEKYVQPG